MPIMTSPCTSASAITAPPSFSVLTSTGAHGMRASPSRTALELPHLHAMRLHLRQEQDANGAAHRTPPKVCIPSCQQAPFGTSAVACEQPSRKRHYTEASASDAAPESAMTQSSSARRGACCPPPSTAAGSARALLPGASQRGDRHTPRAKRVTDAPPSPTTHTPSSTLSDTATAKTAASASAAAACELLLAPPQPQRIRQHELHPGDFVREEVLGEGSYSVVTLATHRASGLLFALKEIDRSRLRWRPLEAQLRWEINLQRTLRHPNIVRLYSYFTTDDCISLVLEYCRGGTLLSRLHAAPEHRLLEKQASRYTRHVAKALAHLHARGVAHRDLKLENVLIDEDGIAKLADFGWSRPVVGPSTSTDVAGAPSSAADSDAATAEVEAEGRRTVCGTLDYLSPEMVSGQAHSAKTDVWSLGVMLTEMLTGTPPFYAASTQATLQAIRERSPDLTGCRSAVSTTSAVSPAPVVLSAAALSLLHAMLQKDPAARPTMAEVLCHPWLQKPERVLPAMSDASAS